MEMGGLLREPDHFVRTSANKHPSLRLQIRGIWSRARGPRTGRKHPPIPQEDRFNERWQKKERNEGEDVDNVVGQTKMFWLKFLFLSQQRKGTRALAFSIISYSRFRRNKSIHFI